MLGNMRHIHRDLFFSTTLFLQLFHLLSFLIHGPHRIAAVALSLPVATSTFPRLSNPPTVIIDPRLETEFNSCARQLVSSGRIFIKAWRIISPTAVQASPMAPISSCVEYKILTVELCESIYTPNGMHADG